MDLNLTIAMGNSAFDDDWRRETRMLLIEVVQQIDDGKMSGILLDTNGNTVGCWECK